MDPRTRANDRNILVQRFLSKYPNANPAQVSAMVARGGTIHENNERFNRSGDRYRPFKISDQWYVGIGTLIGSDSDPEVRQQVSQLNRDGLTVDEAIDLAAPQLTNEPAPQNAGQVAGETVATIADLSGRAAGTVADGARSIGSRIAQGAGALAGSVAQAGRDTFDALGSAAGEIGGNAAELARVGANETLQAINTGQNAIRDVGDDFARGFTGDQSFSRPDIELRLIQPPQPAQDFSAANTGPVTSDAAVAQQANRDYVNSLINTSQQIPATPVVNTAPTASTPNGTTTVGSITTANPQDVTQTRIDTQTGAFENLAIDLDTETEAARAEIIGQLNQNIDRAREDNAFNNARVGQNAAQSIALGSTFNNLDRLGLASNAPVSNVAANLNGIRNIGAGTRIPQVNDFRSLVKSRRNLEDTLKQNQDVLQDTSRLEIAARQQAVDDENAQRRLLGLVPISLEDTLDPAVRQTGFEQSRQRTQIATILPDTEAQIKNRDESTSELLSEQVQTEQDIGFANEQTQQLLKLLQGTGDTVINDAGNLFQQSIINRFRQAAENF